MRKLFGKIREYERTDSKIFGYKFLRSRTSPDPNDKKSLIGMLSFFPFWNIGIKIHFDFRRKSSFAVVLDIVFFKLVIHSGIYI